MKIFNSCSSQRLATLAGVWLLGCSSSPFAEGTLTLLTGQEKNAWASEPAAATVHVDILRGGIRTPLPDIDAPRGSGTADPFPVVPLGRGGPDGEKVSFEATAFDDQGNSVLHGLSTPVTVHGFDSAEYFVFLGRPGFARAYGALHVEHRHPLLTLWPNAYLFISGSDTAGADPKQLDVYNGALGSLLASAPVLPVGATSSASTRTKLLLIAEAGAVWLDLINGSTSAAAAPTGLAFSEVIGGKTFIARDNTQYIVGATRSVGAATDKVLRVDQDGSLHALELAAARLGAAAGLVEDRLLIAGGSASGAGAELFEPGSIASTPLELPADPRTGAALSELSESTALLTGGTDPKSEEVSGLRVLDLGCSGACGAQELGPLGLELGRLQTFALGPGRVLVVGESQDGETHALSLDLSDQSPVTVEQPFRERRAGASAALLANGQVAVVGGNDPESGAGIASIELFFP